MEAPNRANWWSSFVRFGYSKVKLWAEVIDEASARLHFFKQGLQYDADSSSGMEHLRKMYDKYIPKAARTTEA